MAKGPLCRYFGKPCLQHNCEQYVALRGKDPQSGAEIDSWMCIDKANLIVALEGNKDIRRVEGETNALRNEVNAANVRILDWMTETPVLLPPRDVTPVLEHNANG